MFSKRLSHLPLAPRSPRPISARVSWRRSRRRIARKRRRGLPDAGDQNPTAAASLSLSSFFFEKPSLFSNLRKKPSVDGGAAGAAAGAPKKDFTTAILERKKSPNRLIVDDATNDDNR